jgi:hypothetical protein
MPPKAKAKSPAKPRGRSPARSAAKPRAKSPAKPRAKSPARRAKSPAPKKSPARRAKSPAPKKSPRRASTTDEHRALADDLAAIRAAYAKENGLPPPAKAFDFWTLLNVVAWIGWSCVLASAAYDAKLVLILELMCCAELLRMVVGDLKGNVRVGLILHATRLIVYHQVLPTHYTTQILQVWSVTELARYPYYVFKSPLTFALRSFVPLITFPLGVVAETLGLVARLRDDDASTAVKCLCALPLVTTLLAPIGYWSLLKKAVRAYDGLKED